MCPGHNDYMCVLYCAGLCVLLTLVSLLHSLCNSALYPMLLCRAGETCLCLCVCVCVCVCVCTYCVEASGLFCTVYCVGCEGCSVYCVGCEGCSVLSTVWGVSGV